MKTERTALYRHRDKNGTLLYVGISLTLANRLAQHESTSHWFAEVATVDVEWFPTRHEAMAAERRAITTEYPRCNIAHAKPSAVKPGRKPGKPLLKLQLPRPAVARRTFSYESESFETAREAKVFLYRTASDAKQRATALRDVYESLMARQGVADPLDLGHRFWLPLTNNEFHAVLCCVLHDEAEFLLDHCEFMNEDEEWLIAADDLWGMFCEMVFKWDTRRDIVECRWPHLVAA